MLQQYLTLKKKIINRDAKLCVVGLGYVGLPLAVAFAKKGFRVYGFDTNPLRVARLKEGKQYIVDVSAQEVFSLIKKAKFFPSAEAAELCTCDVIVICVPTPLRKVKVPDISYVVDASEAIRNNLRKGQLIILESTSYPTTTREVVLPILKQSGLKEEEDFFLCFSPERVNPADKKFPFTSIPKIVGGLSEKSTQLGRLLYAQVVPRVFTVSSPETAETAKLLENTFRLVNIALVNEFAILCNKMNIDIWEVIEAAKTKPFGFMPFYPGPGLGGHCIPVDPLYLSWKANKLGFKTKMIDLAAGLNRFMPEYVVERLRGVLGKKGITLNEAKILLLGVAYKKNVKDLRESPALDIIEKLRTYGAHVDFYDPLFSYVKVGGINLRGITLNKSNLKKYDCVALITDHSSVDYGLIRKNARCIFDTRNIYKKNDKVIARL